MKEYWETKERLWSSQEAGILKEVFKKEGIKAFLFDLDDTLTKTYFSEGRRIYMKALEELSGQPIDEKKFMKDWGAHFEFSRHAFNVNPLTHYRTSIEFAKRHGIDFDDER